MSLKAALGLGFLCIGFLANAHAAGIDPALWKGLDVRAEPLPGRTWFNGVEFKAVQLVGRDVEALVVRWQGLHRRPLPLLSEAGGWQVHSILNGPSSEVLQVSRQPGSGLAIWSVMTLDGQAPSAWPAFPIPADCRSGPEVRALEAGHEMRQRSVTCRNSAEVVLAEVRGMAAAQGLEVVRQWSQGFEAMAHQSGAQAFVMATSINADTALLLIEKRMAGKSK